jgi:hypothetical protein
VRRVLQRVSSVVVELLPLWPRVNDNDAVVTAADFAATAAIATVAPCEQRWQIDDG